MSWLFPAHLRTLEDGLYFLWTWAFLPGGIPIGTPSVTPGKGDALIVNDLHVRFEFLRTQLSIQMTITSALAALYYRFDYRREGTLLWRADCHPGHEVEFGGPYHLHIGPSEHVRVASPPYSLQDIADLVARTNRGLLP